MIRKADTNDKEALIELFKQLVAHHVKLIPDFYKMPDRDFFEEEIDSAMNDENREVWIDDEEGVSALAVIKLVNVDYPDRYPYKMCYIDYIAVKEDLRHAGIGSRLMAALKKRARESGCRCIQLKVNTVNKDAVSFYEKTGFTSHEIVMTEKLL